MEEQRIKNFSDEKLLLNLGGLFDGERKTNRLILLHLLEMHERKLYAKRGFDSLFAMLVGFYKLSEGSANRRIQAMRLLKDVPFVQESIVSGELNLTTLSMAQIQIRQQEKIAGQKMSIERKAAIVESIKNKTQAEASVELFKQLPATATLPRNEERRISENETRLSQNFPDLVLNKLKRLREVWSHIDPNMGYVEIIERCADETLKRVDPAHNRVDPPIKRVNALLKDKMPRRLASPAKQCVTNQATEPLPISKKNTRPTYYARELKQQNYSKAEACCEFVDPKTQQRCRSKFLLQIDHKVPIWAGGRSDRSNLQLLCSTHNRLKYAIETNQTFLSDQRLTYRSTGSFQTAVGY